MGLALTARQQAEVELQDTVFSFYADPVGFANFVLPFGEEGTLFAQHDGLDKWQHEVLTEIGERVAESPDEHIIRMAVASGHGIGKGFVQAILTLWFHSTRFNAAGVTTANTFSQLNGKTAREVSLLLQSSLVRDWFKWTATKLMRVGHETTWFQAFIANSEHNSQAFAGLHADDVLLAVDEGSTVPRSIYEVLEGATTGKRVVYWVAGNPTENTGYFREIFGRYRTYWNCRNVDSRTARMATQTEANKRQIEQWAEAYGEDSDFFKVRVKGEFPAQSSTQFISRAVVEAAQARKHDDPLPIVPKQMGVDIARYGTDASVIAMVQGRKLYPMEELRGQDLMTVAAWVGAAIRKHKPDVVFIDAVGLGSGVVDRLRMLGFEVIEVHGGSTPSEEYRPIVLNKRAECWTIMKEWLSDADIPAEDRQLVEDLTGVQYGHNRTNMKLALESKEEMRKRGMASPDRADALSYCFAFPPALSSSEMITEPEPEADY